MTADKMISYAELVKRFDDCCGECGCCIHHLPDHSERNTHCLILNSLKAVDAVPVVRCRECMFSKKYMTGNLYCELHNNYAFGVHPDGFCYRGAKMDGGAG